MPAPATKGALFVPSLAIVCLTTLEIFAIQRGIDGYLFGVVVAAIALVAGYKVSDLLNFVGK